MHQPFIIYSDFIEDELYTITCTIEECTSIDRPPSPIYRYNDDLYRIDESVPMTRWKKLDNYGAGWGVECFLMVTIVNIFTQERLRVGKHELEVFYVASTTA